jgi:ATP-dependent DNA helicase RecQ
VRDAVLAALAAQLGALGNRPVAGVVQRVARGRPQAELANAAHRCRNVLGAFAVDAGSGALPDGPVLLLDDERDSGWTATVVAAALRDAGVPAVLPFALVQR